MKQKIIDIKAHNFGPISDLQADFTTGDILVVKGGNASGKTSFIEGLWDILRQQFPKCPLKKGATEGYYSVTITDGTTIEYNAATGALTLTDANKEQMGKAVAKNYLKSLVGDLGGGFDIDTFIHTTAAKPRREMLGKLTGQSGSDIGEIEKAQADYVARFNDRTEASQKLTAQKARAVEYSPELAAKSPVDAAELSRQKSDIEAHNVKFANAEIAHDQLIEQFDEFPKTRASIEADRLTVKNVYDSNAAALKTDYETELARLKQKYEDDGNRLKTKFEEDGKRLTDRLTSLDDAEKQTAERLSNAQKWLNDDANKPKDTAAIDQQLQSLNADNEAIANAKRIALEHDELARLQEVWNRKNEAVVIAEKAKTAAIAACKLPAGLSFDESGEDLLLNGMPLEKASKAEKTIVALMLQLSQMGDLALVTCDLSHLDPDSMDKVVAWLRANDLQAAIEIAPQVRGNLGLHVELIEEHLGDKPQKDLFS